MWQEKTAFITLLANYYYKVMPSGLKNTGSTYQRLMNKIFIKHIGKLLKVYIDDMFVKISEFDKLILDLNMIFKCISKHNMRLNPPKYAFAVKAEIFFKVYVNTQRHWS